MGAGTMVDRSGRKIPTTTTTRPRVTTTAQNQEAQRRLLALNTGPAHEFDLRNQADVSATGGNPHSFTDLGLAARTRVNTLAGQMTAGPYNPYTPKQPVYNTGSSGGGGGGGGGGGAAAPTMSQADLDWAMSLFGGARPQQLQTGAAYTPGTYTDPVNRPFDPTQFNFMDTSLDTALGSDRAAATQASQDLINFLTTNYQNAYNQPQAMGATMRDAPGMSQDALMAIMRGQGVDPSINNNERYYAQGADAAFDNRRRLLAGAEDTAQRSRLNQAQMDAGYTQRALDIAGLQGHTGIGLQRAQAQTAYQQQQDEAARQAAMTNYQGQQQASLANWQRQNEVSDTNVGNQNTFRTSELSALLSLLPQFAGLGLNMPSLASLGLGSGATGTDPADPYNWKGIRAALDAQGAGG